MKPLPSRAGRLAPVALIGLLFCAGWCLDAGAQPNSWTGSVSGYWENPDWSLGVLPGANQTILFTNAGWKALGIGANTTANYSNSLAVDHLTVDAPADSFNQLLLNYAGLGVPLFVNSDFIIGPNGSLASHYSALRGGNLYLSGPATFSESSTLSFSKIELATAELDLTNSSLTADLVNLGTAGMVSQCGGSSQISSLQMYGGSAYSLNNGTLIADSLALQALGGSSVAQYTMLGGYTAVESSLQLGYAGPAGPSGRGEFLLQGGCLQSAKLDVLKGTFTQTGGTNMTPTIDLPGTNYGHADYFLSSGILISSNVSVGYYGSPFTPDGFGNLTQSGGIHTNSTLTLYGYLRTRSPHRFGRYSLTEGLLVCGSLKVNCGTFTQNGGTSIIQELDATDGSYFELRGGELVTSNATVDVETYVVDGHFSQTGGTFTVQNQLLVKSGTRYGLTGGTLNAANVNIGPGGRFEFSMCAISNSGHFTIQGGGEVAVGTVTNGRLGKLQITNAPSSPALLDMNASGLDDTILQFQDSREIPWSGTLRIQSWHPALDRIVVGTDSQGLTSAQLSQITFFNPVAWPLGDYAATLLPTGELVPARAEQADGYTYVIVNGTVTITGYTGPGGGLTIPSTIADLPVTTIGYRAFSISPNLTAVTIPGSVTTIGTSAFSFCTNLTSVTMGNGVSSIEYFTFDSCTSLTNVTIGNSVTNIGNYAFQNCTRLASITIPDIVITIGNRAFYACTSLTNVVIGRSVTAIGYEVFYGCFSLTAITAAPLNGTYSSVEGVLFNRSQTTLIQYPVGRPGSYTIPNSVTTIGDAAFRACTSLTSITIPDSVTTLEDDAFADCAGLTNVTMGNSLTNISGRAFQSCTHLTSITIPNSVTTIEDWAFSDCASLSNVVIGSGVTSIGSAAFHFCTSLTSVTIPNSVTTIEFWAFASCTNLVGVYFRGNAPGVGSSVFYNATVYYLPGTTGWGTTLAERPTAPWVLSNRVILDFGPSFGLQTNRFGFIISWATNTSVVVEACTSLADPAWCPLQTNALTGGWFYFSDPQWTNYPGRFYRVRSP